MTVPFLIRTLLELIFMLSMFALHNQCNCDVYLIFSELVMHILVKIGVILSGTSSSWILWLVRPDDSNWDFQIPIELEHWLVLYFS